MKIKILILALGVITLLSCSSELPAGLILMGTYVETVPQPGRTQLHFLKENRVMKTEMGSNTGDTFLYEIVSGNIKLIPPGNTSQSASLPFEILSGNKFKIGNLHPVFLKILQ